MGNYQICDFCGNLCEKSSKKMCKSCEEAYEKIRSIVEVYPDTMVIDISKQTGISASKILSFARNGFFVLKEGQNGQL
ncbi:hypothetical protein [Paenibacillus sanguinis]|uniref:hypothetical protein n=1 Tax=Paenibacillus sanguinis TaxID=225906 RepID=UPI000377F7A5|nr:hypothetical protein [Paenibacillus sanguinis]